MRAKKRLGLESGSQKNILLGKITISTEPIHVFQTSPNDAIGVADAVASSLRSLYATSKPTNATIP